jgi:hypothetical protein
VTHVAAVPSTPAVFVGAPAFARPTGPLDPPPSPDPLACDLQLASVAVSAARRDSASSHPGRAHFSLPRRTCVCALQIAAPQRCRKWNIYAPTAASRFSIRYRSAISSAPVRLPPPPSDSKFRPAARKDQETGSSSSAAWSAVSWAGDYLLLRTHTRTAGMAGAHRTKISPIHAYAHAPVRGPVL